MSASGPIVRVVDDDASVRRAVERLLSAKGYVVRSYGTAGDYLLAERGEEPGCLILDLRMPGPSGMELFESATRLGAALPVVFLTGHGDVPTSVRAMKGGAVDFLSKPVASEALLEAVARAVALDAANRTASASLSALRARFDSLTEREREVLAGVVAGRLNKQIAARLGIAERTVKAHRAAVMAKMHAGSVAELVQICDQLDAGEARVAR